jgi:hypothetical protein
MIEVVMMVLGVGSAMNSPMNTVFNEVGQLAMIRRGAASRTGLRQSLTQPESRPFSSARQGSGLDPAAIPDRGVGSPCRDTPRRSEQVSIKIKDV